MLNVSKSEGFVDFISKFVKLKKKCDQKTFISPKQYYVNREDENQKSRWKVCAFDEKFIQESKKRPMDDSPNYIQQNSGKKGHVIRNGNNMMDSQTGQQLNQYMEFNNAGNILNGQQQFNQNIGNMVPPIFQFNNAGNILYGQQQFNQNIGSNMVSPNGQQQQLIQNNMNTNQGNVRNIQNNNNGGQQSGNVNNIQNNNRRIQK
jgi:hypothetical protein